MWLYGSQPSTTSSTSSVATGPGYNADLPPDVMSYDSNDDYFNNTTFFEWDQATHSTYFKKLKDVGEITIPKLNEMAYEQVEVASVPFLTFVANKGPKGETANYSFVLRGYVRHWLGNVWAEYDRIKLTDLVAARAQADSIQQARAAAG